MDKYIKVMFGNKGVDFEYKIGEVNIATVWNPFANSGEEFGGFNYASEEYILRWLHRGDTLYDVEVPEDAENILVEGATPIYRCNKIILTNPRKIDDDMAMHFYEISKVPEYSFPKVLGAVAIMNYKNTALRIFSDKINKDTIDIYLDEWNDFIFHKGKGDRKNCNETVILIEKMLNEYKSANRTK